MTKPYRQAYGLGSIIKKAAKGLKKIVKSPLGKAALIGGIGAFGLGSLGGGTGWGRFGPSAMKAGLSKLGGFGARSILGTPFQSGPQSGRTGGLWNWIKGNPGKAAMIGAGAAGMALPFMAGEDEEEEVEDWSITPSSIASIRNMARKRDPSLAFMPAANYVQSGFYAADGGLASLANGGNPAEAQAEQMLRMEYQKYRNQGGTMSYQQFKMAVLQQAQGQGPMAQGQQQAPMAQPQMAAGGGLMNLGGVEKDYRQEGGFVPLGKKEKADDVPARLSKNEFVFTADAVRNAGGGDIDQGAEVMQNMMENLESGGQISEDSQGAQGMYNQQQMLQSRMA